MQYTLAVTIHAASAADGSTQAGAEAGTEGGLPGDVVAEWQVARRFSQFAELDHELHTRHAEALSVARARMPSKFRLPSSLHDEGEERRPKLEAYLQRLLGCESLRHAEQLVYFLANTERRRRLWRTAVHSHAQPRAQQLLGVSSAAAP